MNKLTPRQEQVLKLAKKGFCNKQIAEKLKLKQSTINVTLHNAYKRMGKVLKR